MKLAAYWIFDNKSAALKTENKIKKLSRDQKIKLIEDEFNCRHEKIKGTVLNVTLS